ncbi:MULTISPECIES: hypothetical protein [Sphingobium]|jgi:hypothetical protein|uniref:Uncharacterized protein n=1 Tax=Sphingobium yanoikuyae TaxID=13690 RepID=A0A6P1GJB4_SPHYA|nr:MULTISPECIES: hypothetical protein [Sphingobium]QHD67671.1 hypothetical protein GS397_11845 [Sphingobium yanoikuyae]
MMLEILRQRSAALDGKTDLLRAIAQQQQLKLWITFMVPVRHFFTLPLQGDIF